MPTTLKDHYALLHLPSTATHDQIKAAYRKQAFLCHPDRGESPARMRELNEAWATLGDPDARRAYDTERTLTSSPRTPSRSHPPTRRTPPAPTTPPLTDLLFAPLRFSAYHLGRLLSPLSKPRKKKNRN